MAPMPLYSRTLPSGFIARCLPSNAAAPPSGKLWLHEVKHDGFRVIARKNGKRVKLYSRPGNDLTWRFPLIVEAVAKLRPASCIIDGEAVACGEDGLSSFDRAKSGHCRASCRASRLPFLRAITRKPSCLTSCSHSFGWRGRGIGGGGMAE
jgi:hypothetical protein